MGVIAHGLGAGELATTVADAVRIWDRDYRESPNPVRFELLDGTDPLPEAVPGRFVLDTARDRIVVDFT